ncbi:hypothetical protein HK099_000147 [Clydaea vesicula]|uniref:Uncharacterized protein n=1 Tax=Clydaea vesicula TaxID=447962 RepID=A0AAD5TUZ2_9FUNG|nr:hypothetical protein HK099_000147 [Clydaea vesicula]
MIPCSIFYNYEKFPIPANVSVPNFIEKLSIICGGYTNIKSINAFGKSNSITKENYEVLSNFGVIFHFLDGNAKKKNAVYDKVVNLLQYFKSPLFIVFITEMEIVEKLSNLLVKNHYKFLVFYKNDSEIPQALLKSPGEFFYWQTFICIPQRNLGPRFHISSVSYPVSSIDQVSKPKEHNLQLCAPGVSSVNIKDKTHPINQDSMEICCLARNLHQFIPLIKLIQNFGENFDLIKHLGFTIGKSFGYEIFDNYVAAALKENLIGVEYFNSFHRIFIKKDRVNLKVNSENIPVATKQTKFLSTAQFKSCGCLTANGSLDSDNLNVSLTFSDLSKTDLTKTQLCQENNNVNRTDHNVLTTKNSNFSSNFIPSSGNINQIKILKSEKESKINELKNKIKFDVQSPSSFDKTNLQYKESAQEKINTFLPLINLVADHGPTMSRIGSQAYGLHKKFGFLRLRHYVEAAEELKILTIDKSQTDWFVYVTSLNEKPNFSTLVAFLKNHRDKALRSNSVLKILKNEYMKSGIIRWADYLNAAEKSDIIKFIFKQKNREKIFIAGSGVDKEETSVRKNLLSCKNEISCHKIDMYGSGGRLSFKDDKKIGLIDEEVFFFGLVALLNFNKKKFRVFKKSWIENELKIIENYKKIAHFDELFKHAIEIGLLEKIFELFQFEDSFVLSKNYEQILSGENICLKKILKICKEQHVSVIPDALLKEFEKDSLAEEPFFISKSCSGYKTPNLAVTGDISKEKWF